MSNPEPPKADVVLKVPRTNWQNLREMAAKRELVMDNINAVLEEHTR